MIGVGLLRQNAKKFTHLSVYPFICLFFTCLPVYPFTRLPVYPFTRLRMIVIYLEHSILLDIYVKHYHLLPFLQNTWVPYCIPMTYHYYLQTCPVCAVATIGVIGIEV